MKRREMADFDVARASTWPIGSRPTGYWRVESPASMRAALAPLERALTLADPEGYVRVFVDEGPGMAALLQVAAKGGIAPGYVQRLLSQFGMVTAEPHAGQNLIEPLSERELEVLRLL